MKKLLGVCLGLALVFCACKNKNKNYSAAPQAFFMKSDNVALTTTLSTQGTNSNKITDLWLYVNGQFKGAYPLGATLPIVSSGYTEITLFPGIKNNGISNTRQPYEFFAPITIDTIVDPRTTIDRKLNFQYKSSTIFHFKEGFEGWGTTTGITMNRSLSSDVGFTVLSASPGSPDVFEGNRAMYFELGPDDHLASFESAALYNLPASGAPVYLELNYKCDAPFEVGVYNGSTYRTVVVCNTSANWNKIYAQLSFGVSSSPVFTQYGICIRYFKSNNDQPRFFIDNLKLLSY